VLLCVQFEPILLVLAMLWWATVHSRNKHCNLSQGMVVFSPKWCDTCKTHNACLGRCSWFLIRQHSVLWIYSLDVCWISDWNPVQTLFFKLALYVTRNDHCLLVFLAM